MMSGYELDCVAKLKNVLSAEFRIAPGGTGIWQSSAF
jgi:hypothetical protein